MEYNPDIHRRHTIRLDCYDYSSEGCYFVTICTIDKKCLFGKIVDDEMQMNDVGRMVERWYVELEHKFSTIQCLDYVVMPNHFHCIIYIGNSLVGADLCVRPDASTEISLPAIIQWFKTMSTNEYYRQVKKGTWPAIGKRLWQRNYYEHIVRSQISFEEISDYIKSNPTRWVEDTLFVD